jgi:hypothetical protein
MRLRLAFALSSSMVIVAACNPQDCQGEGFITPVAVVNRDDVPNIVPLCPGNNITVIGDVNVTNQAQLDTLLNCRTVIGNVMILNSIDIVDLSALATLETIDQGYLLVFNNAAITSVDLPRLARVAYGIGIIDNPSVTAAVFPSVVEAFGDITVRNNPVLTNLSFTALEKIQNDARGGPGNLIIADNDALPGFRNFGRLKEIQGFFSLFGNASIQDFQGLENLESILNSGDAAQGFAVGIDFDAENDIVDAGNERLTDMSGLERLATINGDIFIGFNPSLTSLAGLDGLRVHQKNIFIVGNRNLRDLSGLDGDGGNNGVNDGLQIVNGSIFIGLFFDRFNQPVGAGNGALLNLKGLDNLLQLDGSLVLAFNPQLEDLVGLRVLPAIGGDLVIAGSRLDGFNGADALTTINGNLFLGQIFGNDDQVLRQPFDVAGNLVNLNTTDISVNLDPAGNNTDFPALTTVAKDVVVAFADMRSLRIADTLTTIGGRLILHGTDLVDLSGIDTVTNLGGLVVGMAVDKNGNFSPSGNDELTSFNGLAVNALGAGGLAIGFNPRLNNLGSLPNFNNIAGDVTIAGQDFTSLEGLDVTTIGGDLNIGVVRNANAEPLDFGLDDLTAINMQELTAVGGSIAISFNDALVDVGFAALGDIDGALEINANANLRTINGLNALVEVGSLRVHDLPRLETMQLPNLARIRQDLFLTRNANLVTIDLTDLTDIDGSAHLSRLQRLTALGFLAALNTVEGSFFLVDNDILADMSGLDGLQRVGGDFLIARNRSLNNIELASLTTVGGTFELAQMDGLRDLQPDGGGTQALAAVGDALRIRGNRNLQSLQGLEAVVQVGLTLSLVDNVKLATVLIDNGGANTVDPGDVGLVLLREVGNPNFDDEAPTGDRGVIEAQDNPLLDEGQLDDLINDLNGFRANGGFLVLCGNLNQELAGSRAQCGI